MINNNIMAREKLCNKSATVKIIRPSVKLDLIFLYIWIYDTRSTNSNTMLPAET